MTGTSLVTYEQKWADAAQEAVANEPTTGGSWLTARGGQLIIDDQALPGNQAAVIILDSIRENTYYGEQQYDPQNPLPPVCYAMARDNDPMFPHTDMQQDLTYFTPQHRDPQTAAVLGCDGCPRNEWGSATQGKGKACQNRRRLVMIPAGYYAPRPGSNDFDLNLFDDAEHFERADLTSFKLPVTSVGNWSKYVQKLAANVRRPPYGVVTRVFVQPHQKHQYEVQFDLIDMVPDSMAELVMGRNAAARQMPLSGYNPPDPERRAAAAPTAFRGGFQR